MGKIVEITPFNRIEGDLKIKVEIKDGRVVNAFSSGVMFRGFEQILTERDPLDSLIIAQRICGICGTAHLAAAALALDKAYDASVPENGALVRDICLAVENIASNMTHFYLMFLPDLTNKNYSDYKYFRDLVKRFELLKGNSYRQAIRARMRILEIVAILGGQWPHSHFMIPGGVASIPRLRDITTSLSLLSDFKDFIEDVMLGESIENWLMNKSYADLESWLLEPRHANSDLGLFIRFAREAGLEKFGRGCGKFMSYGAFSWSNKDGGYFDGTKYHRLNQKGISEHIKHSYYEGYEGGKHPYEGLTIPSIGDEKEKYSWAKAPRYKGNVVEVGPLARMILDKDPLFTDICKLQGSSVFSRVLARLHEIMKLIPKIESWLNQIDLAEPFYKKPKEKKDTRGFGLIEAPRGSLGDWIIIEEGKIKNFQVITPTAWNASPRDSEDKLGAIEQALIGTPVKNLKDPVEIYHVIRSFDPCLVCTVHAVKS